jgi:aryl-alcohol dehydrogenase-like predicted oxidoreductase
LVIALLEWNHESIKPTSNWRRLNMEYRTLGRTGVRVSSLCCGTMSFGAEADAQEAGRIYAACRERGVNFFDTANSYNGGESERILGCLIREERDAIVLSSKIFNKMGKDLNAQGGNRRNIALAVDASLKRLGTDRIDVLFMHRWDSVTPLEETLRGLEDVVRAGKVLYLGASNYSAWQVAKGLGISAREGWSRFDIIQPMYNLVKRQVEAELLPFAQHENVGVVSYSPVGGGLLSGKYGATARPNTGRLVDNKMYGRRYSDEWAYETAERFTQLAQEENVHPVSLAVAWVRAHSAITAPIIGARTVEQLAPSLAALDVAMDDTLRSRINALSRDPAPATDRLEERK